MCADINKKSPMITVERDTSVFGTRIREMRLLRNLTQAQLSAISGIDQSDLSKLERGIRKGNLKNAIALARALDTSIDYLIGLTDQKTRMRKTTV